MTHRTGGRVLNVKALARVEGEGALHVAVQDGEVIGAQLNIYEPPRFFEAFLRGRGYQEPPDVTARICGICPVAYQMSACRAIEDACGVTVDPLIAELRRLLYCGEWIESHALHIYMLHAPDFLGYPGAVEMAKDHRALVERGLRMKKIGNDLLEVIGGRAIHPINVRVGGFYRTPTPKQLKNLLPELTWARQAALDTVAWVAGFDFPDYQGDWESVAIDRGAGYPVLGDHVGSASGALSFPISKFSEHIHEEHVAHSNALQGFWPGGEYMVGPLARFNVNRDKLPPLATQAADGAGLGAACHNPFQSIIVRAVELVTAFDAAIGIIEAYEPPAEPATDVPPRAGVGHGATEAPRGLLYHRYEIDDEGTILDAVIVPPTSQNQRAIEHDLSHVVEDNLELDDAALTHRCEVTIRNYDPCISCATHFLELHMERS